MALEELSAAAPVPKKSAPQLRRLRLLESVLCQMPNAIAKTLQPLKRYHREFWINCLNPCLAMQLTDWRFDLLYDSHEDLVGGLLECLEDMVQVANSDISQGCKAAQFPRLETLAGNIIPATETTTIQIELAEPTNADL